MVSRDHVDSVIVFIDPVDFLIVLAIRPHFVMTGFFIFLLVRIWFDVYFSIL